MHEQIPCAAGTASAATEWTKPPERAPPGTNSVDEDELNKSNARTRPGWKAVGKGARE
jgi:hypothetical protein